MFQNQYLNRSRKLNKIYIKICQKKLSNNKFMNKFFRKPVSQIKSPKAKQTIKILERPNKNNKISSSYLFLLQKDLELRLSPSLIQLNLHRS